MAVALRVDILSVETSRRAQKKSPADAGDRVTGKTAGKPERTGYFLSDGQGVP